MLTSGLYGKEFSTSFNSAIVAPAQKIKPKVIIKWLDSRHLDNLVITTNDAPANTAYPTRGFFFPVTEAFNGIKRQSFTWGVAGAKDINGDVIKADGSWYAMPSLTTNDLANTQIGSSLEFGWWSNSISTSNAHATYSGYGFTTDPYIQATFTTRKVNKIRIVTSEFYGQISTYTVEAYDGSLNLVLSEVGEIPIGGYYMDHILSSALTTQNISKIKVIIHSTSYPQDYARIQEVIPLYEEDISDYIISYSVNRTRDVHSTSLPIGGSETAVVDLTLDNTTKVFNLFNTSSLYGKYMVKDLEVEVFTGWRIKKPSSDNINASYLETQITSSITDEDYSFTVLDKSSIPTGGSGNEFIVVIDRDTQSEEIILCSSVNSSSVVTVLERGYGGSVAKNHSAGSPVRFDIYEYVKNGTFYVDEWSIGTDMTVSANLQDWTKYLSERTINYGFFLQNSYADEAVENLLLRANFPKADIERLQNYKKGARARGAVASYSFNEDTVDRSGNNIIPATGLRARFWGMPTNKKDVSVKDILADAIDKELSPMDKALEVEKFTSPTITALSKAISSSSAYALDLNDYTFTGVDGTVYSEYYNGVFDGYYIPTDSGLQQIIIRIAYGGVRVYLDDIIILNRYNLTTTSTRFASSSVNLTAGVPRKIRIEFYHSFNTGGVASFDITLYKALSGGSDVLVSANECCTIVALDSIGTKDPSRVLTVADANNHRNNAIYINSPKLSQPSFLVSDLDDKSVLLESNSYIRIPSDASLDVTAAASWSIEFYGKFHNGVFSGDGEYLSSWNNSSSTAGFEFFNNSTSHGFKVKAVANSVVVTETVSSNTALSNSSVSHLVATFDGENLKYYVNGTLSDTETVAGEIVSWASKPITIGGRGATYTAGAEVAPATIRSLYADEFAIYNECLTSTQVSDRYTEAKMQPLTQFAFLYGNEDSIRGIMDGITFADMGRVYVDETDHARYEHYYRFFEPTINQHAVIQTSISDSTNITEANYVVSLQCNKVIVPVGGIQTSSSTLQSLWTAPDNASLAVTALTANLASNASGANSVMYVSTTLDPVYPKTGYIKIDDEIIKYISKTAVSFNGLERGQFQTTAAAHTTGAKVRESRYYDLKFDKAPAYNIRSPFVSSILFDSPARVEISRYLPYAYGAELIVSATTDVEVGKLAWLQGTNPETQYPYATTIGGIAVEMTEQNTQVKEQSASTDASIKKYGIKDLTIQSPFITDSVHAKKLADFIIEKTKSPVPIINISVTAMPKVQLGDRIRITALSALDIVNTDYWVISHTTTIGDTVTQNLVLRGVS
ncbi:Concanavalin A-like lectin/glucanases superfamily [uncultured Caudovirales phage]|uniref:Concanavalin A-like lectin/glucanases superfamily n=1 Tax=uncultured Caudovirales phage TaxID=2100421 RepID=A0A6J5R567_9CAUD|nr:Concanavalin A-like lectin/glucanases superfamily [uncultured Caudovirales phage]CAB4146056.1 Concanavalin A-like lectin/glucanases superfamily [uncultured Caudovirales phage]CAB4150983.1 Concanavalin A-like lectin/glucanases superfamily [uncultured Caudovirales phage]CAB4160895.1 Concanavalin A-like lectin/glucanases superfamily [uncultured Caudovirales phage]CAB4175305.1 Concanavalin A-like lectin/glucanases superfamily [uncultured Caudovirales phage]